MVDSNTSKSEDLRRIVMRWMMVSLLSGLVLAGSGFYLLTFTNITTTMGLPGIGIVVALITLGLLFALPAKVYIILRFTRTEVDSKKNTSPI
jgi:hypothetical protein